MKKSRLLGAVCALLAVLPFTASAVIVQDPDFSFVDNGTYTTVIDTANGTSWDWLDVTETANWTYSAVEAELGAGGLFDGWRYATRSELGDLWAAFGGDPNYYSGWSTENNDLFFTVSSYLGDAFCENDGCTTGTGASLWITADIATQSEDNSDTVPAGNLPVYEGQRIVSAMQNLTNRPQSATMDSANLQRYSATSDWHEAVLGSALVRISAVPVPAAVWLFGSGLLGLVGLARRKKA